MSLNEGVASCVCIVHTWSAKTPLPLNLWKCDEWLYQNDVSLPTTVTTGYFVFQERRVYNSNIFYGSWVHKHLIIHFKYIQFTAFQLHLNKLLQKLQSITRNRGQIENTNKVKISFLFLFFSTGEFSKIFYFLQFYWVYPMCCIFIPVTNLSQVWYFVPLYPLQLFLPTHPNPSPMVSTSHFLVIVLLNLFCF